MAARGPTPTTKPLTLFSPRGALGALKQGAHATRRPFRFSTTPPKPSRTGAAPKTSAPASKRAPIPSDADPLTSLLMEIASLDPRRTVGSPSVLLAIAALVGVVLRHSPFGIRLFLMGTNPKAARYAGIPVQRMLIATYTLCGLLAAVAGVIIASRTSSAKWDFGSSYLMIAILTVVMAGVKPEGGYGRALCLLFSATLLQVMSSAFNLIGISSFFRDFAWGALLLISLASSQFKLSYWLRR